MKKLIILGCSVIVLFVTSCKKNTSDSTITAVDVATQLDAVKAIAVGTTNLQSRDPQDSIYAIQTCNSAERKNVINFSSLAVTINTYLTTNYVGYTPTKAVEITNNSGVIKGFIAVINFNGKPVAIKFDAAGNFVKILELRQGIDLFHNQHFHHGGCYEVRDGLHRDTIAISALPSAIISYFTTNYATEILIKAFQEKDSDIVVISRDTAGVLFATVFNKNNVFIKRILLQNGKGKVTSVAEVALLSSISNYLVATYPGYTFKQAFSISKNSILQRFIVLIDANNIKYVVEFDALGAFLEVHIIH